MQVKLVILLLKKQWHMQTTYVQLASELSLEQESYRTKMMKKCSELNELLLKVGAWSFSIVLL